MRIASLWFASAFIVACGKSPEKLCEQLFEARHAERVAAGDPAFDDAKKAEAKQECVSWLAERKAQYDAEIFDRMTACLADSKDTSTANRCRGEASDLHRGYDPAKLKSEFTALATALDGPLDGLRALDADILAASRAMTDDADHRFEHLAKIQLGCAAMAKALAAVELDGSTYSQQPVRDVVDSLSRARTSFELSLKSCQGMDCAVACVERWTDVIRATQTAELGAKVYDATIEPIRPREKTAE